MRDRQWTDTVSEARQPGDVAVCRGGENAPTPGPASCPPGVIPATCSDTPVLTPTGLYQEPLSRPHAGLVEAARWGIAITTIAVSAALQIGIVQQLKGWTSQALLILTVLAELSLLSALNRA